MGKRVKGSQDIIVLYKKINLSVTFLLKKSLTYRTTKRWEVEVIHAFHGRNLQPAC